MAKIEKPLGRGLEAVLGDMKIPVKKENPQVVSGNTNIRLESIEANPYQCKGHFIGSRDDLCIYSNDLSAPELYFKTKQKCPRCRKDMRPWKRAKPICPKCKNVMDSELMETWIE